ncbi:UDP-N-acetylhexosamine pyrophosphorylase [Patella vulgata]|uniref:UDP-N-acetylhexosamine pyrophosphorylase n=1 Tax=Patella vulgata TaxID=6465 RepID=UPI0024A8254A|nr:UDP-N-acetylhexosamine pyrophosphorylase [Patella vulgata]XP_050409985.2 UDP-N-acetylhexosamine pyrophosphorylase [Patella vulgata]XP_050409986.2 UDP-N-acetylhexosamine pyrophosphorylase [Patella vulgata]XP_050409987.2 UDP-N-acetylhexosamine pyrophosphorylase [Patella vulgata]XP_050409988.2 UDP-N-acetylhexosamine pyrophosphorylase [Patella vulgata]
MDAESLRQSLAKNGQEHLLQFWDKLSDAEKSSLQKQISSIEVESVLSSFHDVMKDVDHAQKKIDDKLKPVSTDVFGSFVKSSQDKLKSFEEKGLTQIGQNKVGVLLLAGGQGTRLGVNYPKGMVNVSLPSEKTLFQLQAERILKVQQLAKKLTGQKCVIPWYIMTSEHTKGPTEEFFKKHNYFGLDKNDLTIFEQSRLPCIRFDGKIILEAPSKIAMAPDGNGGLYRALRNHQILEDMSTRGIEYVHVYCVDNILVKMADPIFIGFCIDKGARCGAKSVVKESPTESVGVVCKVDGIYQVVEYSEISLQTAQLRDSDGNLVFNAGNICNHFFTLDFLKEVSSIAQEKNLKYHIAKKKIPFVTEDGQTSKPETPNGIKMEKFVFDVFQFCSDRDFAVWEVLREEEFSPLKNSDKESKDTPTTCRQAIFKLHQRYVEKAGGKFINSDGKTDLVVCEISPLVSYAGEGLNDLVANKTFVPPVDIEMGANGVLIKDGAQ